MGLHKYYAKRDFSKTAEPRGKASARKGSSFVIQKHAARRLHYDLRLEHDGVMWSWAVTKGPSLVPGEKRLAIHVEDHPIEYNAFEGTIPEGQYGGGTVMIWDRGKWIAEGDPAAGMKKGHLDFSLEGEKLSGRWHLVRLKPRPGERQEPWLLIKSEDEAARGAGDPDILDEMSRSVATGRTMEEIASAADRVWHSNRGVDQDTRATNRPAGATTPKRAKSSDKSTSKSKAAVKSAKTKSAGTAPAKIAPAKARSASHKAAKAKPAKTKSAKARSRAGRKASNPNESGPATIDVKAIPGVRKSVMADFVSPCLASLIAKPPAGAEWVHEIKFDGYRMQARIAGGKAKLLTRKGLDWTHKFQRLADAVAALPIREALIDGEIVSANESGVSDFSGLQEDLKTGRHDRLNYYLFDLLHLDGYDLTRAPLIARKQALAQLTAGLEPDDKIKLSEHFETEGAVLLKHACGMGLEGIISKLRDAPYRPGRGGDWLKAKCTNRQELIVAGYEPSATTSRSIRSLVLAYRDKQDLHYAGRVGTGFTEATERDLLRRMDPLKAEKHPFPAMPAEERRRKVVWLDPKLVVEVEYRGWTHGGVLRQGSFKGVRDDKPASEVVLEVPMPASAAARAGAPRRAAAEQASAKQTSAKPGASSKKGVEVAGVRLTHADRVYWEDAGVTKAMLANFYAGIWDWIAPHLVDRPLALVRCPEGATAECFFQKHASAGLDAKWFRLVPDKGNESFIAVKDLAGLIALVQAGVLEIHTWGTIADEIDTCNRLVFDLDPGPDLPWKAVIAGARDVRERLAKLGLDSFLKTTGGKGLHVVAPIAPTDWDIAKGFAHDVALAMAREAPERYVATMAKKLRTGRIFVDYLRNGRGATAIAPYSTRARPGATVSVPLSWDELSKLDAPNSWTVLNLDKRLKRLRRDPWEGIGELRQELPGRG